jgi:uncharacterized delta-60 repeat protein
MSIANAPRFKAVFFVALFAALLCLPLPSSSASTMAIEPDGKIVLVGSANQWRPRCPTPSRCFLFLHKRVPQPVAARLDADGHPDPSFGVGGGIVDFRSPGFTSFTSVALPPGRGIRLGSGSGSRFQITALDSAGDPDFGFGHDGLTASPSATMDAAYPATILSQPDGSLVVGGNLVTYAPKSVSVLSSSVAVAMRFSADGEAQGLLGEVSTETVGSTVRLADLVSQGDAIIAVGALSDLGSTSGFLARFSGSIFPYDPSFGGGSGLVQLGPFPRSEGEVGFLAAAADESGLIAVGYKGSRILLARFHADGTLDQSFGEAGVVNLSVPSSLTALPSGFAAAYSVIVQPDGRYVVAGSVFVSGTTLCNVKSPVCAHAFLARFEPGGGLDTSFGEGGFVVGGRVHGRIDLARQVDGKLLLSASSLHVARYNADGRIDTSFGERGEASLDPCQGTLAQRRRSGCLSTAAVDLKAHGLGSGKPVSQFSIRVSNPLDPVAAVKLLLPPELEGRKGTTGNVRVLAVPRTHVRIKVRPRAVSVSRLANARGLHVAVSPGVLRRIEPVATDQKLLFRVEIKFKDGTSQLFGFHSSG